MIPTAFITGGARGIGAATVRKFVHEGYNVAFTDINTVAGNELADELGHDHALFIAADTRDLAAMQAAAEQAERTLGPISVLFCNAGIHRCNTMLDIDLDEFDLIIRTNIYGTFYTMRAVVPHMVANGGGAIVINDSDQWFVGKPLSFAYGLTKGALGQITRSLSIDLGSKNIRVNAVCPGTIHTDLVDNLFVDFAKQNGKSVEDYWKGENQLYARGKAGLPEEVAELVFFLASDKASFCTGGHYLIDGGLTAQ
ncbi:MAG: SDR family oxidoreductase [Paludibacteraceae bacterium]|nr:SDR family oxidoreductase [Paludibacteraceae bacterium]